MTFTDHPRWIWRLLVIAAVVGVALVAVRWLPLEAGTRTADAPTRQIVLVARGMAFYVDGDPTPNPTLHLRRGERVRLVLRNADPGVTHNLAVNDWRLATRDLRGEGSDQLEFVVPDVAGQRTYQCTPHAAMMRGTIAVR